MNIDQIAQDIVMELHEQDIDEFPRSEYQLVSCTHIIRTILEIVKEAEDAKLKEAVEQERQRILDLVATHLDPDVSKEIEKKIKFKAIADDFKTWSKEILNDSWLDDSK